MGILASEGVRTGEREIGGSTSSLIPVPKVMWEFVTLSPLQGCSLQDKQKRYDLTQLYSLTMKYRKQGLPVHDTSH